MIFQQAKKTPFYSEFVRICQNVIFWCFLCIFWDKRILLNVLSSIRKFLSSNTWAKPPHSQCTHSHTQDVLTVLLWFSPKAISSALNKMREVFPPFLLRVYGRLGFSNAWHNLHFFILSSEYLIPISLTCSLYYFLPTLLWDYSVLFLTNSVSLLI